MPISDRVLRLLKGVRRWRGSNEDELAIRPDLPESDAKKVRRLFDEIVEVKGGEVAARRRARRIGLTYATLNSEGQRRFFEMLASEYGHNDVAVDNAIDQVQTAQDTDERRNAEWRLREALQPQREQILRRFVGLDGGLPFLVDLREDLRSISKKAKSRSLGDLDRDLRRILERWFDIALLDLQKLTWSSPAALLEKLIEYEAVHAIGSWDDLKGRLGPGRRCYAFVHPAMEDDPLIFVEVALTSGMADSLVPVLDPGLGQDPSSPQTNRQAESDELERAADTAIFYSISNCHGGLAGVSLGNFLIKSVVEELKRELPNLEHFATLSPLPGFRVWIEKQLGENSELLTPAEQLNLEPFRVNNKSCHQILQQLVEGPAPRAQDPLLLAAKPALMRLGASYIVDERRNRRQPLPNRQTGSQIRAFDPVAHFHLANGARAERLNWSANLTEVGWERGLGLMINYKYELKWIEANHDSYTADGTVIASEDLQDLARIDDA